MTAQAKFLSYRRSRFSTRLPLGRFYTASHFWLLPMEGNHFRIGLTKFAVRMLGDLVETGYEVKPESRVAVGEIIGWVECLKAASDLFCVADGHFVTDNPKLNDNAEWLTKDPYGKGWLYEVRGTMEPNATDAEGYAAFLDATIDKMMGEGSVGDGTYHDEDDE